MTRNCAACTRPFEAKRAHAKFCSETCRKRGQRKPTSEPLTVESLNDLADKLSGGLVEQVRTDLETGGVVDTTAGQQALVLARRIGSPMETGAAVASMSKRLSEVMAEAMSSAKKAADPLDELKAIRDRKRAG